MKMSKTGFYKDNMSGKIHCNNDHTNIQNELKIRMKTRKQRRKYIRFKPE